MENKYKEFIEITNRVENERLKRNCLSLVGATQSYYSYLMWYEKLKPLNSILSAYLGNDKNKISITDNYIMLMCYEYTNKSIESDTYDKTKSEIGKQTFNHFLETFVYSNDWKTALLSVYDELDNVKYSKYINKAIAKFRRLKKATDFDSNYAITRHNNLENAVNIYINNKNVIMLDKETAFNAIYSDRLVTDISLCIEKDIFTVDFFIAPIRRVLSTSEGKNNRYSEYFDRRIERSYEELKSKCDDIITKYSKSMNNIT